MWDEVVRTRVVEDDKGRRVVLLLTKEHLRISPVVATRYTHSSTELFEELVSVGNLALINGLESYKLGRGNKLESWLFQCVIWDIHAHIYPDTRHGHEARWRSRLTLMDQEGLGKVRSHEPDPQEYIEDSEFVEWAMSLLTEEELSLFTKYHVEGKTLRELSPELDVSWERVRQRIVKIRQKILDRIPDLVM